MSKIGIFVRNNTDCIKKVFMKRYLFNAADFTVNKIINNDNKRIKSAEKNAADENNGKNFDRKH